MIVIDIEMPLNCRECPFREKTENGEYCMAREGKKITCDIYKEKTEWCPIRRVL